MSQGKSLIQGHSQEKRDDPNLKQSQDLKAQVEPMSLAMKVKVNRRMGEAPR